MANHALTAGLVLLALVGAVAWILVLVAILVGRGIGKPKDGRRGFWFAIVLLIPLGGLILYALFAMPELPRLDRAVWLPTLIATVVALVTASVIQEGVLARCASRIDDGVTSVLCTEEAPSIATTVGVTVLVGAVTAIVARRERVRRSR